MPSMKALKRDISKVLSFYTICLHYCLKYLLHCVKLLRKNLRQNPLSQIEIVIFH